MEVHGLRIDSVFLLLAISAMVRPGHSFQACPGERIVTGLTDAKRALSDPTERSFDRSQETTVGLMQADLHLRFGVGGGVVGLIAIPASCSWNPTFTVGVLDRQFAPFGEQHPFVSVQLSSIHFQSCRIRTGRFWS
jgi:hypothetical protein